MDQIEAEVENEDNEEEVNFEVNWRNDFEELEKALEDDSGESKLFPVCSRQGSTDQDTNLSSFEFDFARRYDSERLLSFQNLTCDGNRSEGVLQDCTAVRLQE